MPPTPPSLRPTPTPRRRPARRLPLAWARRFVCGAAAAGVLLAWPLPVGAQPAPATTTPPPVAPAPSTTISASPSVAPAAVLSTVDDGLQQLQALANLSPARQDVANAQATVESADQAATTASTAVTSAAADAQQATSQVSVATHRVVELAVASYMGESDLSPTVDPGASNLSGVFGGVSTPAGSATGTFLDPAQSDADAAALLQIVTTQATANLHTAHAQADTAQQALQRARTNQSSAQDSVNIAQQSLDHTQQLLTETVAAATTPGVPVPPLPPASAPGATSDTTSAAPVATAAPAGRPVSTTTTGPAAASAPTASTSTTTTLPTTSASTAAPGAPAGATPASPDILGPSTLTAAELAGWFASTGHPANATVPIPELAQDYITAGNATGVRGDIAFAQSVVETGYFSFPSYGQVTPADNNFAGIGACDSCATGLAFPNALTGVSAQMELLEAYATPAPVATPLVGHVGVGGCCSTWMALTGTWATNPDYGVEILTTYAQMLAWAIPQRLSAAGLSGGTVSPPGPVAITEPQPPTLATTTTLPGGGQGPSLATPSTAAPPTSAVQPGAPQVTAPGQP